MQQREDGTTIYSVLLHEIQHGIMPESGYFTEIRLAERFGVSRTPVRDVLNRLALDRMLERTPRGLKMRDVTPEEIIQVYDARILLEAESASQAARNRHITDVVTMRGLIDRDRALEGPDDATRARTNLEFHGALWSAAHNPVLDDLLGRLSVHMIHKPTSTLSVGKRWSESLDEHDAILEAITSQDSATARQLMAGHMETARDLRLQLLGQRVFA